VTGLLPVPALAAGDPGDGCEALVRVVTGAPDEPPVLPDDPAEEATVPPEDPAEAACDPLVRVAIRAAAVPPEPAVEPPAWDRLAPVRTPLAVPGAGRPDALAPPCRPAACPAP
jgi:hypothetical protein